MITVKATFDNNNSLTTRFNGTYHDAVMYYFNNWFNLGIEDDDMHKCIKVELV